MVFYSPKTAHIQKLEVRVLTKAAHSAFLLQRVFGLNIYFYRSAKTANDHRSYQKRILLSINNFSAEWVFHYTFIVYYFKSETIHAVLF